MFTGVYRVIKGVFCNICRENPVIFTDCREIPADIAEKPLNHPVNPCKDLQCSNLMKGWQNDEISKFHLAFGF